MKNTVGFLLLATLMLGGGIFSLPYINASSQPFPISITLPQASIDLSDLDLRDKLNRPIHSPSKRRQMETLFVNRLQELLFFSLTPSKRKVLLLLSHSWDLLSGWIKRTSDEYFVVVYGWVQKKKEIHHRVKAKFSPKKDFEWTANHSNNREEGNAFLFLLSHLLSSTQILR